MKEKDPIERLISMREAMVLVEYGAMDHPERVFYDIMRGWRERGITPLIVDIWDTLHVFLQNLRFSGVELRIDDVPVIKEKGMVAEGRVLGRVDVIEDFEHHLAIYGRIAKNVPKKSRNHTVVLGMEKFSFTFLDDPPKLERYFETITRRYLSTEDKVSVMFLNTTVASEYLMKGLEADSDCVLRVSDGEIRLLKCPEVAEDEV
ncbi:DUF257 family protein [Thermococcus celer]|uniref:Uncharacterized protein n=1 Tax=Thermococcus celer Vu 13 = JCM 8558 TaxID=1293037 RepID=A0A218P319_THECE|nr:DUF257 family protein [Thermococcus celer]ASI99322.1 hypothetical protein A3L02_06990 [Thermococcus celer Vu 13 = JCM 8558]